MSAWLGAGLAVPGKGTLRAAEALGLLSGVTCQHRARAGGLPSVLRPGLPGWRPRSRWVQRRTPKAPWNLEPLRDEGGPGTFYVKEGRPCAESHHVKSCAG